MANVQPTITAHPLSPPRTNVKSVAMSSLAPSFYNPLENNNRVRKHLISNDSNVTSFKTDGLPVVRYTHEHGCNGSPGYSYCNWTDSCFRVSETKCTGDSTFAEQKEGTDFHVGEIIGGLFLTIAAGVLNGSWNASFNPKVALAVGSSSTVQTDLLGRRGTIIRRLSTASLNLRSDRIIYDLDYHYSWTLFRLYASIINFAICLVWAGGPRNIYNIVSQVPSSQIVLVSVFSLFWGAGSVLFGLGCKIAGVGLGTTVSLNFSLVIGTFVPLLDSGDIKSRKSAVILIGVVIVCAGLFFIAASMQIRDSEMKTAKQNSIKGSRSMRLYDSSTDTKSNKSSSEGYTTYSSSLDEDNANLMSIGDISSIDVRDNEGQSENVKSTIASVYLNIEHVSLLENEKRCFISEGFTTKFTTDSSSIDEEYACFSRSVDDSLMDAEKNEDGSDGFKTDSLAIEKEFDCSDGDLLFIGDSSATNDQISKRTGTIITEKRQNELEYSMLSKISICILAGILGSLLQFTFIFGKELIKISEDQAMTPLGGSTAIIWLFAIPIGSIPSIIFGLSSSPKEIPLKTIWMCPWWRHFLIIISTSLPWLTQLYLYGLAANFLLPKDIAASIAWPILLTATVAQGMILSIYLGEWKEASCEALKKMRIGLCFEALGIIVFMLSVIT